MKVNEILGPGDEPSAKGHYVADVIGMTPMGKKLAKKQTAGEKKHEKARKASKATEVGEIAEQLGSTYAKFRELLKKGDLSKAELSSMMADLKKEAIARGQEWHTMLDDLMGPLSVEQLKRVASLASGELAKVAREELSHRL